MARALMCTISILENWSCHQILKVCGVFYVLDTRLKLSKFIPFLTHNSYWDHPRLSLGDIAPKSAEIATCITKSP